MRLPHDPTVDRRHVLAGLAGMAVIGAAPVTATRVMPLSRMGVDPFATRDQYQALRAAFEAAAHEGFALQGDADARYRHDGALTLAGVSFDGRGASLVALSDGPQVLRCIGRGWRLANLTLLGAAGARDADYAKNGLLVGDHAEAPAIDFAIENVTVGGVGPGRGFAGVGILFDSAHRGRIARVQVRDTKADGIHVTNGSSDLSFVGTLSERTGDDGFAVVSYRRQQRPCTGISVRDGVALDVAGRGFSVVGGRGVRYANCRIERSAAAGLYLFGEGSYDTFGVSDCHVLGARLLNCVTGLGQAPDFAHAAIMIGGREGSDALAGGSLARGAADCRIAGVRVDGAGRGCFAGLHLNEYATRTTIVAPVMRGLLASRPDRQPNGIEIGGRDTVIRAPQMDGIAGTPIVVARTAAGRCTIDGARVRRARLTPSATGSFNVFCYVDDAPRLAGMVVSNGRFGDGPKRLATDLLPPGRLRLVRNTLDGRSAG